MPGTPAQRRRPVPRVTSYAWAAAIAPGIDGAMYLFGGYVGTSPGANASVHRFDLDAPTWSLDEGLSTGRAGHAAVPLPDGRIAVIGGDSYVWGAWQIAAPSVVIYEPGVGTSP